MTGRIPYNPKLRILAADLRKNMTLSEILLWNYLRQRKMLGYKFRRQEPIGNYIVDFFCHELKLAIEIDGTSHDGKYDLDVSRQKAIEKFGITILRFDDREVKKNIEGVLRGIEYWIEDFFIDKK